MLHHAAINFLKLKMKYSILYSVVRSDFKNVSRGDANKC